MTVRSLVYPKTNKIPIDGSTFEVVSDLITQDGDDSFLNGYDSNIWSLNTASNVTVTNEPLSIQFDIGTGGALYQLDLLSSRDQTMPFCMEFGFDYLKDSSTSGEVVAFGVLLDDTSNSYLLEFAYDDTNPNPVIRVTKNGSTSTEYDYDYTTAKIKIVSVGGYIHTLVKSPDDYDFVLIDSLAIGFDSAFPVSIFASDPSDTGVVVFKPFKQLPVTSGAQVFDDISTPVPLLTRDNTARFRCEPSLPGTFELTLYGNGSNFGSSEVVGSLQVLDKPLKEASLKFMVSDIEAFYDDATEVTLCPSFGVSDAENKGDLSLETQCFCDGSLRDSSSVDIEIAKYGKLDQFANRFNTPEFLFKDESDNYYGHNFDFSRLYQDSAGDLLLDTSSERLSILRTKILSDGRRVFYGVAHDPPAAEDIHFDLTYDWSGIQDLDLLTDYDEFDWFLIDEERNIIDQSSTTITISNYTDPGNVPGTSNLDPGKYSLKLVSYKYSNSETAEREALNQGAKIYGDVYRGTSTSDPLIVSGFAEGEAIEGGEAFQTFEINQGTCYINFEVGAPRGHLVVFVHDICNDTMVKYEDANNYVNLDTRSISCFEYDDDKIMLVYKKATSDDLRSVRSNDLTCRSFDLSTETFGSEITLQVPNTKSTDYIHAFDCELDGTDLYIFYSIENDDLYIADDLRNFNNPNPRSINHNNYTGSERRSIPFAPIGPKGFKVCKIDTRIWDFDNNDNFFAIDYEDSNVDLKSLSNFLYKEADARYKPDGQAYLGSHYSYKRTFAGSIRVNKDPSTNLFVVSVLDSNTRMPVVLLGNDLEYKEVAIPYHFDIRDTLKSSISYNNRSWSNIDSFAACFGVDGFIYSVATRGELMELGVIDPNFYWESRQTLAKPSLLEGNQYEDGDLFVPEFRFDAVSCLSFGKDGLTTNEILADIVRQKQYMILNHQSLEYSKQPLIHQNGTIDRLPFETFCENIWTPEYGSNTDIYSSGATFGDTYAELQTTYPVAGLFGATLNETTTYKNRYYMLDRGYKFYARLQVVPDGVDDLTDPYYFYAYPTVGSGEFKFDTPLYKCQIRFQIYGTTATCQVYNFDTTTYDDVATIEDLPSGILDYYLLAQQVDGHNFRCMFVIKSLNHSFDVIDQDTYTFDFKNDYESYFINSDFYSEDSDTNERTLFGVTAPVSSSGANRNEFIRIYEMGYNTLKADTGLYNETEEDKDGSGFAVFEDNHYDGLRWRQFDDTKLFDHDQGTPDYNYRVYMNNDEKLSMDYHWYNGFSFNFFGSVGFKEDYMTIAREVLNNSSLLMSKALHGIWYSQNDDTDVYIWADALDSGFTKFNADFFVALGSNIPEIKIVGRDDVLDPWTEIDTISFIRYRGEGSTANEESNTLTTNLEGMYINDGEFDKLLHYYYHPDLSVAASRAKRSGDGYVTGRKNTTSTIYSDDVFQIFTSKGFKLLDEPVEYRYLGFKLEAFDTYDSRFFLECLDFGKYREIPILYNNDLSSGENFTLESEVNYVYGEQAFPSDTRDYVPSFDLSFTILDDQSYITILSSFNDVRGYSKPIWVFRGDQSHNHEVYLTMFDGDIETNNIVDENGDVYYRLNMNLKGVGE